MREDFGTAYATLSGNLKSWTFLHNDLAAALGQKSAGVLAELTTDNPGVTITVLNIDTLWDRLAALPENVREQLFPIPDAAPRLDRRPILDFAGRKTQIARLKKALVMQRSAAICAVNGMGGVGKTQLALRVAQDLENEGRFPQGITLLSMRGMSRDDQGHLTSPLTHEEALEDLIRRIRPNDIVPVGLIALKAKYQQTWRGRLALIILDDAVDEGQVCDLAPPSPVALLVTSRRKIQLDGGDLVDLGPMTNSDAVDLIQGVLAAHRKISHAEVKELARLCGFLPLALRSAANFLRRHKAWSVSKYLSELGMRGIERLETKVQIVLGLSLEQLTEELPVVAARFPLLGAFPAGFDVLAAAALWSTNPHDTQDTLDKLSDLNLIAEEGHQRYRLHDLLRGLARLRAEPSALEAARERHAYHFCEALERATVKCATSDLAWFDSERDNIEAGQAWAASVARRHKRGRDLVLRYTKSSEWLIALRLMGAHGLAWFDFGREIAKDEGDLEAHGIALESLATIHRHLGAPRQSIEQFSSALELYINLGDYARQADVLSKLGLAYRSVGRLREAKDYYDKSLFMFETKCHGKIRGFVLGGLAEVCIELGDIESAITFARRDIKGADDSGAPQAKGMARLNLGFALAFTEGLPDAESHIKDALEISGKQGNQRLKYRALSLLGVVHARRKNFPDSMDHFAKAIKGWRELGDPWNEMWVIGHLCEAHLANGAAAEAKRDSQIMLSLSLKVGDRRGEANALWYSALAYEALDQAEDAATDARRALMIYREIDDPKVAIVDLWLLERDADERSSVVPGSPPAQRLLRP